MTKHDAQSERDTAREVVNENKAFFMIFCKRLCGWFRGDHLAIISFQYDSFRFN